MRQARATAAALALGLYAAPACTDVVLCAEQFCEPAQEPVEDNLVRIEGQVCTADPASVTFPYKVLFIIDISGSNDDSDPLDNRVGAVRRIVDQYIETPAISFGAIVFSDEARALTPGFTNDYGTLVPSVTDQLAQADGATNYLAALQLAHSFIEDDILLMAESERHRTRYDIQFLSDGVPNPCITVPTATDSVGNILDLKVRHGLFDVSLSTTQLYYPGFTDGCNEGSPAAFLGPMAESGEGTFRSLTSDQLDFHIGFSEIYRPFELRDLVVVNQSRVLRDGALAPDSDTDGLGDFIDEVRYDALEPDVDFDGCSDLIDERLLPNVGLCQSHCASEMSANGALRDIDGDSLPDCAEQTLGLDPLRKDTDGDSFADDIELRFGTNPHDPATVTNDFDRDGINDGDEIRRGGDPLSQQRHEAEYVYAPLTLSGNPRPGVTCFGFSIDQVLLVHTRATPYAEEGMNRVCVDAVQVPMDDPAGDPLITRSCHDLRYLKHDDVEIKEPANGLLRIAPETFVQR
jgi:hypothetical protein